MNPQEIRKRSVVVSGHKTSVSLEDAFWRELARVAHRQGVSVNHLIGAIDAARRGNLSSAIRIFVLEELRERTEGGEGRGVVVAELLPWLIDMNAEFRLSGHPKAPPFGMRLTGPLDNPRRIFKTNRLQAYLVQRGIGSVLKRFLPPKSAGPTAPIPPQPSQQQPQQPQPLPKPEDFIRDILKGLGR